MKRKLFLVLMVMFVSLFTLTLSRVSAAEVDPDVHSTSGSTLVQTADGGVAYVKDLAHAEEIELRYSEGVQTTADTVIHIKGHVTEIYRARLVIYAGEEKIYDDNGYFFAEDKDESAVKLRLQNNYFEYHGNLGIDLAGKTITKIKFQIYTTNKTTERIGEFQLLGIHFDTNPTYDGFADLMGGGNTGEEDPVTPPTTDPNQPEVPVGEATVADIVTKAEATIVKGEDGSQTVTYSVTPGWNTFVASVSGYNAGLTTLEIKFTPSVATKICFEINGVINWDLAHKEYAGGTLHTHTVDLTEAGLPESFDIAMYIDAEVIVEAEKSVVFHSIELKGASQEEQPGEPDDGTLKISAITTNASATITAGEDGSQVVAYNVSPGWATFDFDVKNYDANLNIFEVKFTASANVQLCFSINGVIDWAIGHREYLGGSVHTFSYDLTDANLPSDFTVSMYIDAKVTVESDKTVTFHSIGFKVPEPEPEGMWLSAPVGNGLAVGAVEDYYMISYNNDSGSWRNATIQVHNHDVAYDIVHIKLELAANTNVGIWAVWTEDGVTYNADLRSHHSAEGVATADGVYDLIFHLGYFDAKDVVLSEINIWFDNPTAYTTNTGDVTAKLLVCELLSSADYELGELEYTASDLTVDYTGNPVALDVTCAVEVPFKFEYSPVALEEGKERTWAYGLPTNAGQYLVRISYLGSLEYNYKSIEVTVTINKVKGSVAADDVTVDAATRIVTVKAGIEASTDAEFAEGYEVLDGDEVAYGQVIYYRRAEDANYTVSDALQLTVNRPVEEDPTPVPPTQGGNEEEDQPTETPEQPQPNDKEEEPEESKGGCGGSVVASIIGVLTLAGAVVVLRKKREE